MFDKTKRLYASLCHVFKTVAEMSRKDKIDFWAKPGHDLFPQQLSKITEIGLKGSRNTAADAYAALQSIKERNPARAESVDTRIQNLVDRHGPNLKQLSHKRESDIITKQFCGRFPYSIG